MAIRRGNADPGPLGLTSHLEDLCNLDANKYILDDILSAITEIGFEERLQGESAWPEIGKIINRATAKRRARLQAVADRERDARDAAELERYKAENPQWRPMAVVPKPAPVAEKKDSQSVGVAEKIADLDLETQAKIARMNAKMNMR